MARMTKAQREAFAKAELARSGMTAEQWTAMVQQRLVAYTCLHGTPAGMLANGKAALVGTNCSACQEINRQYANRNRARHAGAVAGMWE